MSDPSLYWDKVSAIGQVAGAVATFAAVIAALWLARSERRFNLRVTARFGTIVDVNGSTNVVTIEVENVGLRTARITGFGWTTGFANILRIVPPALRLRSAFQMPDYRWAINPAFPWVLEPGEARATHMRRQEFIDEFGEPSEHDLFRKLPWGRHHRLIRHRITVGVYTRRKQWSGRVHPNVTRALEAAYRRNRVQETAH